MSNGAKTIDLTSNVHRMARRPSSFPTTWWGRADTLKEDTQAVRQLLRMHEERDALLLALRPMDLRTSAARSAVDKLKMLTVQINFLVDQLAKVGLS